MLLKMLRRVQRKGPPAANALSDREAVLGQSLEKAEAELEQWKSQDAERGRVYQKMRARLNVLKRDIRARKEQARDLAREVKSLKFEVAAPTQGVARARAAIEFILTRPGMPCPISFAEESARSRKKFVRDCSRVWKYPMRLGVLHQHEACHLRFENLPEPVLHSGAWPKISVATPSFNHAAFLERTMRSVLDQDYPALEYFVADGGSTDGTVNILKRHESRLAGWLSEKDHGPADAVNKALGRSSGEIMAWLNSDDLWVPGLLKFVGAWFAAHPDVDVIYGHRWIIDERDNLVGHWTLPRHDGEMLLWADFIPQETMFWRRRIWEKAGPALDESFKFAFDWELLLRFQRAGARIVRLPWFMGCFRVHPAQKSSADISTVGFAEMARLRERELGEAFNENSLSRHVVACQRKAIWCDRLWRAGIRW